MNWKKWLGYNLYKKFWSVIGGRPWTFIRRDIYHLAPLVNIVVFITIGFFSGLFYHEILQWVTSAWWHPIALVATFWFIGVLQSHFHWGKDWIEGQKGD